MKYAAVYISTESGDDFIVLAKGKNAKEIADEVKAKVAEDPQWWSIILVEAETPSMQAHVEAALYRMRYEAAEEDDE